MHRQALPKGTHLQEYELQEVLGSGGFGIAYLAYDHHLNQAVVIKEYLPGGWAVRLSGNTVVATSAKDEEQFQWGLERFLSEARTLANFRRYPNIVSVLSFFKANNTGYMVMEYAGPMSLQDYLDEHQILSEEQVMAILLPLLQALDRIHAAQLIHRDIKPGNIIINAEGQPVLIDFGSARHAFGERTMTLTSLVTHGYSPFEQYTNTGKQGPWTDIYALSAVLYRCVTGKVPPTATDRMAIEAPALLTREQIKGKYSPALLAAIDWGLQVSVAKRPQSVSEWRQKLLPTKATMQASLPPLATTAPKPGQANPYVIVALVLGILGVLGIGAYQVGNWLAYVKNRSQQTSVQDSTTSGQNQLEAPSQEDMTIATDTVQQILRYAKQLQGDLPTFAQAQTTMEQLNSEIQTLQQSKTSSKNKQALQELQQQHAELTTFAENYTQTYRAYQQEIRKLCNFPVAYLHDSRIVAAANASEENLNIILDHRQRLCADAPAEDTHQAIFQGLRELR